MTVLLGTKYGRATEIQHSVRNRSEVFKHSHQWEDVYLGPNEEKRSGSEDKGARKRKAGEK